MQYTGSTFHKELSHVQRTLEHRGLARHEKTVVAFSGLTLDLFNTNVFLRSLQSTTKAGGMRENKAIISRRERKTGWNWEIIQFAFQWG